MQQTKSQLQECQTSHRKCTRNIAEPVLPTRILNIGGPGNTTIKIQDGGPQLHGHYVALSYCWGGQQRCQTTIDTVDKHFNGMQLDDLSLSIQDAVEVSRELGFQYLWVDALCIIQDSEEDRNAEIGLMGSIYKNATLTLAASSALNAEAGFLRRIPTAKHFKLPYRISEKSFACVNVSLMGCSFENPFKKGARRPFLLGYQAEPLDARGWALQERLLASQVLSFGTNGITWTCQSGLEAITKLPDRVKAHKALPFDVFNNQGKQRTEASFQRHQIKTWHSIVEDYTRRSLSVRSDYSRAITGIASELASYWNDEYLAGTWRRTFANDLAWRVVDDFLGFLEQQSVERGQNAPLEGPSWSWLSKLVKVSFLPVGDVKLQLVNNRSLSSLKSPNSDSTYGSVTVHAACYEFRYKMEWRYYHYWLGGNPYTDDTSEFSFWPDKDSRALLDGLLLGFSGNRAVGLIVERIPGPGIVYRRRGLWDRMSTPAEHAYVWEMRSGIPGCNFREVTLI